jgi:hypothetical protein
LNDRSLLPLFERYAGLGWSEEELLAAAKLAQFPDDPFVTNLRVKADASLLPLVEIDSPFLQVDRRIASTDKTSTSIQLSIASSRYPDSPIYAVAFTLSNRAFFTEDGQTLVPSMTTACGVMFQMHSKKASWCQLQLKVVYTTSDGDTLSFRLIDDSTLLVAPIGFISKSPIDFATVWREYGGGTERNSVYSCDPRR